MKRWLRITLIVLGVLLLLLLVGPLLVPVPPLEDTVPPRQLAGPDSRFVELNGIDVHYKLAGQGEPVLVLLHGFGASLFSWREVIGPLSEAGTVVAFDRPAFGLTERPMPDEWEGENPYSRAAQVELTIALLDELGVQEAVLVGNSAGGTIALLAALEHPERVGGLVLVDPAIYEEGGGPSWLRPLLRTPQMRRLGPLLLRSFPELGERTIELAWHDPGKITPEVLAGYKRPLQAQHWDRALYEFTLAQESLGLAGRLDEVDLPTLVITGDDDRIVPTEQSVRLAGELPAATLVVIPDCGHVPQEECPGAFLKAVESYLGK